MYISGAKFEDHCFHTSRDILNSVKSTKAVTSRFHGNQIFSSKQTYVKQDGGAVTIASLLSCFENENKSVLRGGYRFKSNNVESFSARQGVFKGQVHASMKKIVYNVTISEMR